MALDVSNLHDTYPVRLKYMGNNIYSIKRGTTQDVEAKTIDDLIEKAEKWLGTSCPWQLSTAANYPLSSSDIQQSSESHILVVHVRNVALNDEDIFKQLNEIKRRLTSCELGAPLKGARQSSSGSLSMTKLDRLKGLEEPLLGQGDEQEDCQSYMSNNKGLLVGVVVAAIMLIIYLWVNNSYAQQQHKVSASVGTANSRLSTVESHITELQNNFRQLSASFDTVSKVDKRVSTADGHIADLRDSYHELSLQLLRHSNTLSDLSKQLNGEAVKFQVWRDKESKDRAADVTDLQKRLQKNAKAITDSEAAQAIELGEVKASLLRQSADVQQINGSFNVQIAEMQQHEKMIWEDMNRSAFADTNSSAAVQLGLMHLQEFVRNEEDMQISKLGEVNASLLQQSVKFEGLQADVAREYASQSHDLQQVNGSLNAQIAGIQQQEEDALKEVNRSAFAAVLQQSVDFEGLQADVAREYASQSSDLQQANGSLNAQIAGIQQQDEDALKEVNRSAFAAVLQQSVDFESFQADVAREYASQSSDLQQVNDLLDAQIAGIQQQQQDALKEVNRSVFAETSRTEVQANLGLMRLQEFVRKEEAIQTGKLGEVNASLLQQGVDFESFQADVARKYASQSSNLQHLNVGLMRLREFVRNEEDIQASKLGEVNGSLLQQIADFENFQADVARENALQSSALEEVNRTVSAQIAKIQQEVNRSVPAESTRKGEEAMGRLRRLQNFFDNEEARQAKLGEVNTFLQKQVGDGEALQSHALERANGASMAQINTHAAALARLQAFLKQEEHILREVNNLVFVETNRKRVNETFIAQVVATQQQEVNTWVSTKTPIFA